MPELAEACPDGIVEAMEAGLQPGDSALLVMVEQRYAERVAEELETRGLTLRRQMQSGQCEAALRASIEEIKSDIAWLEDLLHSESDKAGRASGAEKDKLEAGIRAALAELAAKRENLQARLQALRAELEGGLLEIRHRFDEERAGAATALGKGVEEAEQAIADVNEDLARCILDHLDGLTARAFELREKTTRASMETAAAIEDQLRELEVRMRKHRADLTATLASSASLARRCMERLRANAGVGIAGMEGALRSHTRKMEQRHAMLKADIQRRQRKDAHA
jgi:hypothetical protein